MGDVKHARNFRWKSWVEKRTWKN